MSRPTAPEATRPAKALLKSITEADVRDVCLQGLAWRGLTVISTEEHRRACPRCGHRDYASGQQKGLGDALIRDPRWPTALHLLVDWKRPVGWRYSSPEQRILAETGSLVTVHCFEDLERVIREIGELRGRE